MYLICNLKSYFSNIFRNPYPIVAITTGDIWLHSQFSPTAKLILIEIYEEVSGKLTSWSFA